MIAFLENKSECRERILLAYFDEKKTSDCGHCDVCKSKQKIKVNSKELRNELLLTIKKQGKIPVRDLIASYPAEIKENVLAMVRTMIDEQTLSLDNGDLLTSL